MLEEVEFLKGLQSVDTEDEVGVLRHTEASHGILQLNVIEDDGSDVVGILLSKGFIWSRFNMGNEVVCIVQNRVSDLGAEISRGIVSLGLRVADSEGQVGIDGLKICLNRGKQSSLWVLLDLGSLGSSGLMSGDIGVGSGV